MKMHEINQTRAIQVPDNFIARLKWRRLSPGLWTTKHGIMIAAVVIAIAALGALAVLAQGKGKSTDPAAVMPNLPVQAIKPASGSRETDILVDPMPMQAAAEKHTAQANKDAFACACRQKYKDREEGNRSGRSAESYRQHKSEESSV